MLPQAKRPRCVAVALVGFGLLAGGVCGQEGRPGHHHEKLMGRTRAQRAEPERELSDEEKYQRRMQAEMTQMDAQFQQIQDVMAGKVDVFGDLLPSMMNKVTSEEAEAMFKYFPILETTKTFKAFVQSGKDDAAARTAAMVSAVKELGTMVPTMAKMSGGADALKNTASDFMKFAQSHEHTRQFLADLQGGDPTAMGKLQQAFSDKYMNGLELDKMYDNTWIDEARDTFLNNDDLVRIVGDNDLIKMLSNPALRLTRPEDADPSKLLEGMSFAGF